jgi:hypothetical protein
MQPLKTIALLIGVLLFIHTTMAQTSLTYDEVNTKSYALYEKDSWKELLTYGKEAIQSNQDFTLLRLRMGYAAFMLNNFSEAINQYEHVLQNDSYNSTAHYYIWLCRKYLNQPELADAQVKYLSKEVIEQEKLKRLAFTQAGFELSLKQTDATERQNPTYARVDIGNRLGWNIHMLQSVATYQQTIGEPQLTTVTNNRNININQFEYYNKLTVNLNRKWQLIGAYHYVYTPFNNLVYNNHLGLLGVKYNSNYFNIQGDIIVGTVTDAPFQQINIQLGLYPLGNLNLYGFSTVYIRQNESSGTNFKQVIGFKINKNIWLEGNATLGMFQNLAENDAMYLYNAIDINKVKTGITGYFTLSKKCIAQLGYTFEQRQFYNKTTTFNQHSTTGGLSWKF